MQTVTYSIPNISCKHCVHTITTELSDLSGVKSVQGEIEAKRVTVVFDAPATQEKIEQVLEEINYPIAK
jgi:copper ion binding protein